MIDRLFCPSWSRCCAQRQVSIAGLILILGASGTALAKAPAGASTTRKVAPAAADEMAADGAAMPDLTSPDLTSTADGAMPADEMDADAMPAKRGAGKTGKGPAAGAKRGAAAMEDEDDGDFLRLPNDPPTKDLKIVDAFRVDGPVTAEQIAAAKLAATKKPKARRPAAPAKGKTLKPAREAL